MEPSDEALMTAHRQGDAAAFGQLVRRYADSLLGYLVRLSGDRHCAEDLFQETFGRAYHKAGTFDGRGTFRGWLYAIATRTAIDSLRKRQRERVVTSLQQQTNSEEDCPLAGCLADAKATLPPEAAVRAEQAAQVRLAVAELPLRQRAALVLAYYEGLSYKQIAGTLGCSVGTVKTQVFRALRTLATRLEAVGGAK